MANFLLPSLLSVCLINAFTLKQTPAAHRSSTHLLASGGPPQYDKFEATLRQAETVADGSVMLHIDTQDIVDYEPGHVIALEMSTDGDAQDAHSKTRKDAKENGGWIRGPYTVSRSDEKSFDVLLKVVGEKSKQFTSATPGTPFRYGGKFHVPILEGISTDTTKRVVFVSTGVGVGPCTGAIEEALRQDSFPPIDLIASYRMEDEVVSKEHLDDLQRENPDRFSWKTIITSKQGRLSTSSDNLKALKDTVFDSGLEDTHYHLIGNGQMVSEFKAGLEKAGVSNDKVTVEMYFNHKAEVDAETVDRIAAAVMESAFAGVVR